ncbi:MAG: hypothetical protein AB7Q37_03815 [Pyrinomonadaceae bacterium]
MRKEALRATIVTGVLMPVTSILTASFASFAWALALFTTVLSLLAVYFLVVKRAWNAAGAAVLSIVVFSITTGILHIICVVISAVAANQMWTSR